MEDTKLDQLLQKRKSLQFFTNLLLLGGVIIFTILYVRQVHGRLDEAFQEPQTVTLFLVPFIPACLYALKLKKINSKIRRLRNT